METKHFTLDLKAAGDDRTVEGLGSVFGNTDQGGDIVVPGAFAKSLKSRTPAMLWQHKADQPIGVWDELRETPEGLFVKGRILNTALGNDAYELARHGALKGMSIGYATKDSETDRKSGVRRLKELDLFEVSLVTFPMNELAGITRVKQKPADERALEEYLREAGYSRTEAKAIVAKGHKGVRREADAEARFIDLLNQFNA